MKIYVDARCLQDESYSFRGVGYHSSTLLLAGRQELPPETEFVGLIASDLPCLPGEYQSLFDQTLDWSSATFPEQGSVFLQLSPMTHNQAVCSRFLDRSGILAATLVYDFIPLDAPQRYLSSPASLHSYAEAMLWLNSYDLYFPISKFSERRLLETTDCGPEQSFVTGVTLRKAFEAVCTASDGSISLPAAASGKNALPTNRDYFLFVGGADPRKNVDVVLNAHARQQRNSDLVIVGHYPSSFKSQIADTYQTCGGKEANLIFRQGVPDDQLAHWYRNAISTVCSSYMEGFSLPVIEAMACGSPAIVSNIDAHRELVRNPAHRFSPDDPEQLAGLMKRVIDDRGFRDAIRSEQACVPRQFFADVVGQRTWAPIVRAHARAERIGQYGWYTAAGERPRQSLAILSPFPPERSGVADYTLRSIEALSEYVDVDVFTDCEHPTSTDSVRQFFPINEWAYASGGYDRVLSVVGNSHFHIKIIELQRKYGGPCLMHDNRLAELYNWWKGPEYFRQLACKSLGREVSLEESQGWIAAPGTLPGVFFDELMDSANPLIVHSRGIQSQVELQYGKPAAYLPFCVYRQFDDSELQPAAKTAARVALGIKPQALVVITLGIVAPSKGPQQCIDAVAAARRAGHEVEFYFVGSSDGVRAQLEQYASSVGVQSSIHFTSDWVSDTEYRQFIAAADFAVQLRNSFFGGLSGAMLDCIASGLPTVANRDLAEALDSPNYVMRIGDQLSSEELSQCLLHGIESELHRDRMWSARQEYLRDHSFQAYAGAMLELLGLEQPNMRPRIQVQAA